MDINQLSEKLTKAVFNFVPYNGADFDDVLTWTIEQMKTRAGCIEIIEQLCDMLQDA